ncbi:MAG: hypothetical protein QXH24_03680 [Candidatus Bathyarchaeia archaeon]
MLFPLAESGTLRIIVASRIKFIFIIAIPYPVHNSIINILNTDDFNYGVL